MTSRWTWLLTGCLLLSAFGCGGGDKAADPAGKAAPATAPAGAGADASSKATSVTPAAPAAAAVQEISPFVHHASGDVLLAMARPGRVLVNPIVTGIIQEMNTADPTDKVEDRLKEMEADLGIDPKQVEYVVISIAPSTVTAFAPPAPADLGPPGEIAPPGAPQPEESVPSPDNDELESDQEDNSETPAENAAPPPGGEHAGGPPAEFNFEPPPSPALLVKLAAPVDGEKFISEMAAKEKARMEKFMAPSTVDETLPKELQEEIKKQNDEFRAQMVKNYEYHRTEHAGVAMHQKGDSKDRICFLNSQTLLYAPESIVKAAIDRKGVAETSALATQLKSVQDRDVALALDITPIGKLVQSGQLSLPFPVQLFAAPLLKCKYLTVAADIQGGSLLEVNLLAADEAGAKQLHGMLNPMLQNAIKQGKAAKNDPNMFPKTAAFVPLGEQLLDGTSLTQTGDALSLVVKRPASLGDLPTLVKPLIADAVEQKKRAASRNDLKQIALSMHNYNDSFGSFPGADQDANGKTGLSWRVHILPYLDEAPLYNEFHLDEPWDSVHNKTLIPRMPKTFGADPEGKTSIHLFVGDGAPFAQPLKFADVTDGTSNTIMAVRAGADTADVWTKPGGLTFDKNDPLKALGSIGETFDVIFIDGSARTLPKSIDPATLGNLIQHNDGNIVEIPE